MENLLLIPSIYILFYSFYWLFLTVYGLKSVRRLSGNQQRSKPEILLILPAYKPGKIFHSVLEAVSKIQYPGELKVYVLHQESDPEYLQATLKYGFYQESKSFSHLGGNSYQHALRHIASRIVSGEKAELWKPEFIMILDKDNLIAPDFFQSVPSGAFDRFDLIQGRRESLNVEGSVAFFDSVTEGLNDTMFRAAKRRLGSMIEISGSGALIETDLFLEAIDLLDPMAPGFDKNFMVQLLSIRRNIRTFYNPYSVIREEKTSQIDAHNPQRIRWFGEQYYNALFHARTLLRSTVVQRRGASLDYLITLWRPPRSIQILITPLAALPEIIYFLYTGSWPLHYPLLTLATIVLVIAVALFLLSSGLFITSLKYMIKLPQLAWNNLFNAAKSIRKENRGTFIHTSHKL